MTILVFTRLMQKLLPSFTFPNGGRALAYVTKCLDSLENQQQALSKERVVDFCITQVYAISKYGNKYITNHWNASHSFGNKALQRFQGDRKFQRYYEDQWLKEINMSRGILLELISDKRKHPLEKYIFPIHEEVTKNRAQYLDWGFYICCTSTLLWTPFSPVCQTCRYAETCKTKTSQIYPELFRIRNQAFITNHGSN